MQNNQICQQSIKPKCEDYIDKAVHCLQNGGVIAYPTEAVYGLGCDPLNENAVKRLLELKNRPISKGLILIAATWEQIAPFINITSIPKNILSKIQKGWPGPITWVFPKTCNTPYWISGNYDSVAVRVTAHPVVQAICLKFEGPIVSTSANLSDKQPARTITEVQHQFSNIYSSQPSFQGKAPIDSSSLVVSEARPQRARGVYSYIHEHASKGCNEAYNQNAKSLIDFLVPGDTFNLSKPTPIFDALTGNTLRAI